MKKISRILFALLLASTASNALADETKKGDVNGDNAVTVADVTALVNVILKNSTQTPACDVNGDGIVSKADVEAVVSIILGKTPPGSDIVDIDPDDPPTWEPANAPKRSDDGIQTIGKQTPTDSFGKSAKSSAMLKNKK